MGREVEGVGVVGVFGAGVRVGMSRGRGNPFIEKNRMFKFRWLEIQLLLYLKSPNVSFMFFGRY